MCLLDAPKCKTRELQRVGGDDMLGSERVAGVAAGAGGHVGKVL